MEVNQFNFKQQLLPMLKNIANSSFVAIDLEMSGISRRAKFGPVDSTRDNAKPSLQQLYDETREAAETFQVLQVGITCVEEEKGKEYYAARPYNIYLSPLFYRDNAVKDRFPERKLGFSSSACDFLQTQGFDFGKVFSQGVYYLSHVEEVAVRENHIQRSSGNNRKDAVILPGDTEALKFYQDARKMISTWVDDPKPANNFVNIGKEDGNLNGFQRMLVHQLVKKEFPAYRSFARNDGSFVQIEKTDTKKEAAKQAEKFGYFNRDVAHQIGLRWIFDALINGNLDDIPTTWFSNDDESKPELHPKVVERELSELKQALKCKKIMLVGHNMFMDLVYLYKTFIGTLPQRVETFQVEINYLFPSIIDTKYLASHGDGSMHQRAGLKDLLEPFKKIHMPLILLEEDHTSYCDAVGKSHEAGFDSWMTAELFVKLSAKLFADVKQKGVASKNQPQVESDSSSDSDGGGASLADSSEDSSRLSSKQKIAAGFKSLNPFSVLMNKRTPRTKHPKEENTANPQWLPPSTDGFWKTYINRLRVNAAEEGICVLNSDRAQCVADSSGGLEGVILRATERSRNVMKSRDGIQNGIQDAGDEGPNRCGLQ